MRLNFALLLAALTAALCLPVTAAEISLETAPPVVVRTVPVAGATDVDPALTEITATFSKPMQDGSWSWSTWGEDTFPELAGKIHYLADGRTCVLPVKLAPGRFYASWLNSSDFKNFKDTNGLAAVPYLLTFRTAGTAKAGLQAAVPTTPLEAQPAPAPEPVANLGQAVVLQRDSGVPIAFESINASGYAVQFTRPDNARFVEAVQLFASRYGLPEPPKEDFHLYLLNEREQVLADVPFPYALIERGNQQWYTLRTPSIEVPEQFSVALAFNSHRTKGVYLSYSATNGLACYSRIGLPGEGFERWKPVEWMVRVSLAAEPTRAKGFQSLADWKPPTVSDPFADCRVVSFGGEASDNKESYSDSGPAIRFKPAEALPGLPPGAPLALKGLRLFASRYGSGYPLEDTKLKVQVLDARDHKLADAAFPYGKFRYRAGWVDLVFDKPVVLPRPDEAVTIAFDPEATRYKGIYFHYQKNPSASHSLVGKVSDGFKPVPDREWTIRACFEKAPSGK